jgi:hypothetical protein
MLSCITTPLAILGLGQLVPCAQAQAVLPVTSGLNCWFDASVGVTTSGATVTGWADQSGNGNHATPGSGSPQLATSQINGQPAVLFRGGNNNLNINKNIIPRQEYIVFKSGRYALDPGNPNLWGNDWGAPFGQQNDNGWMFESGSKKMWGDGGRRPLAVSQNGTSVLETGNPNGDPYGMANVANYMVFKVNPKNYSAAFGRIGRGNNSWGNGYFDVAEIIVYDRVLTPTEENLIGGYLAGKYQISTAYPPLPLMVSVTSPANNQAYPTGTSVTAVATVPAGAGTGPYSVQFYKKVGAGSFGAEGSPVTGDGSTFSLSLGVLPDETYQIYADVTDNVLATASSSLTPTTFTVAPPSSTTTALATSVTPSTYGQSATFTATISPTPSGGTVQFYSDATPLGSPVAVNTGTASYSTTLLGVTTHSITAHFSGHGVYLESDASEIFQTVNQAVLTVTADNKVRAPGAANPPFSYKITGYKNGENATSAGITGTPAFSCSAAPDNSVTEGAFPITGTVGDLAAANYSFSTANGTLTVMAGAPPVASGMVCWFDASNGVTANGSNVVQTWSDLSGNGHHGTGGSGTPTRVASQINGKPAIQFTSDHFNLAGSLFTAQQYLVLKSPTPTWTGGGTFMGPSDVRIYDMYGGQSGSLYGGFWTDPAPFAVSKNGAVVAQQAGNNFGWPLNPIDQYMVLKINVNTTAKVGAGVARSYQIGRSADVGYVNFDVAEIIGYDTILSSADENSLGRYLADKYAISAPNYPLVNPPPAPTALLAEPLPRSVSLSWPAPYSAASYNVYRGTASGVYDPTPLATGVSTTTYIDSAVVVGTSYFYVVKAVNAIGEGAASNEATAEPASGKVNQILTFGALPAKTYGDAPFALTANASSGLAVSYASSDESVASVSGNTVTILKSGTATITASQAGDNDYHPASSVDQTLTVSKANQTLAFALGSRVVKKTSSVSFSDPATSTSPSGNPVNYSSSNEAVATVDSSGLVSIVAVGTTQIVANQAGDADFYNDAPQVEQTLNVLDTPLPVVDGLACWFDAGQGITTDGSGVATWADSSTLGHDAIRGGGTVTLVPGDVNSLPAVHLRSAGFMNSTAVPFTSIVKEQYVVVRSPNATWSGGSFFGRKSNDFLTVRGSSYNMAGGTTGFWQDHFPAAVSKNGTSVPLNNSGGSGYQGIAPITDYMILKITVDNDGAGNIGTYPYYQIGKNEGTGTTDFDVAEIIGYHGVLSSVQQNSVNAYLADKYALTVAVIPVSTACDITAFGPNFAGSVAAIATTSATTGTVVLTVPPGTTEGAVAALKPTYTLSTLATCDQPNGGFVPSPALSTTGSVPYTVTAEDGVTSKTYSVTVVVGSAPSNDDYANAINLPGTSGVQTGTNNAWATLETGENVIGANNTVWFKWTAPSNGQFTYYTTGSTMVGGEWDSMIGIYTGSSVDGLTPVNGQTPMDNGGAESMTVTVTGGVTYYIQAAGYENQVATNIKLTWSFVSSVSDYDTWGGPSGYALTGGIADDDDGDGLSNRQEHAFGLNPTSGASVSPITVQLDPEAGTFTYTRRAPSLTNLTYSVWTSTDLGAWTKDANATEGVVTTAGNNVQTVPVTLSAAALATAVNGALFVRVQADEAVAP